MRLLNFLKTNPDARKVFGKSELSIIEKQLLGINLTQSEKNRLSRDIRKKFEFIEKAYHLSDEFKLKKGAVIKSIINEAKEIILKDPLSSKIKKIILFGSVVENKITPASDIDIAVSFSEINLKDATLFRKRTAGRVDSRVDIQVYNHLPKKITEEIEKKGKILYER